MEKQINLGKVVGAGIPAGGASGQVLVKASDADYDIEWKSMEDMMPNASGVSF